MKILNEWNETFKDSAADANTIEFIPFKKKSSLLPSSNLYPTFVTCSDVVGIDPAKMFISWEIVALNSFYVGMIYGYN